MKKPLIKIIETKLLSDNYFLLNKVHFNYQKENKDWVTQTREVYDKGNGAAILLYNQENKNIILTRQFRLPTYLNKNPTGMMLEVCAGLLDGDSPEMCIIRETEEETGYRIKNVKKIMETYPSPGAVTEILHLFVAEYTPEMKVSEGGGLEEEQEDIQVIEISFESAYNKIKTGEIKDAKTIILLQHAKLHLGL